VSESSCIVIKLLLSTNNAGKFTSRRVRGTWKRSTDAFHLVKQSSILVSKSCWICFRTFVHADEFRSSLIQSVSRHEVSVVFRYPPGIAFISSWNHDDRSFGQTATDGAWDVVVMQWSSINVVQIKTSWRLVFGSIDLG